MEVIGQPLGRKRKPTYPQMAKMVWASDGLWGAYLPPKEAEWEEQTGDTLRIDPSNFVLLQRAYKRGPKTKKRPTRLEEKDHARRAYDKLQGALIPGSWGRVERDARDTDNEQGEPSRRVQSAPRKRWPN